MLYIGLLNLQHIHYCSYEKTLTIVIWKAKTTEFQTKEAFYIYTVSAVGFFMFIAVILIQWEVEAPTFVQKTANSMHYRCKKCVLMKIHLYRYLTFTPFHLSVLSLFL